MEQRLDSALQQISHEELSRETPLTAEQKEAEVEAKKLQQIKNKNEKICKAALKGAARGKLFWTMMLILIVLGFAYFVYWYWIMKSSTSLMNKGLVPALLLIGEAVFFSFSRIISSAHLNKRLVGRKKFLKKFPKESNHAIRELYLIYCEKKCIHFWISLCFGVSCFIHILYTCLGVGIDAAVNGGNPAHSKVFTDWDITNLDWSHYILSIASLLILMDFLQYNMVKSNYGVILRALEDNFGREKLIDECMYCYRMHKVNSKYKTICFIIACFKGCLFFLFFKRMLCTIFDKSFIL